MRSIALGLDREENFFDTSIVAISGFYLLEKRG